MNSTLVMRVKLQFTILLLFYIEYVYTVKTCSKWQDYLKFYGENSCKENLDADDDFVGIVRRWGKEVETHEILTYDGYYLTLFRIVPDNKDAPPVLILHGFFMNSLAMVDRGSKSLAYQFVDKGYDVWILNWRGAKYSRKHIEYSTKDLQFWKFSYHEWGVYDLPQALSEIKNSNDQKVLIVGFELGNTAAFIYSTTYPDEAEKNLNGMISLSPTAAPIDVGIGEKMMFYSTPYVFRPLNYLYHGEVPASYINIRGSLFCRYGGIWVARFCDAYFLSTIGLDIGQQDPETLPVIVALNKDSDSVMLFEHRYQNMKSKKFRQYDYGPDKNIAKYGSKDPTEYDISKIKVPQLFFVGRNDKSGTLQDATVLYQRVPEQYRKEFYVIEYTKFGLGDFVQAKDINQLLHNHLMQSVTELVPVSSG